MIGDRDPAEYTPTEHAETAALDEQLADLTRQWEQVRAGAVVPVGGRLWGLPELPAGEWWVDIAGAAVIAGVAPATIRNWLHRGGPRRNPFPPAVRHLYRLLWTMTMIKEWRATQDDLAATSR